MYVCAAGDVCTCVLLVMHLCSPHLGVRYKHINVDAGKLFHGRATRLDCFKEATGLAEDSQCKVKIDRA